MEQEKELTNNQNDKKNEEIASETNPRKNSKKIVIIIISILVLMVLLSAILALVLMPKDKKNENKNTISEKKYTSEYKMKGNSLENFDLYFLKLENSKQNKIYSPLSIKYALEMLEEGANGDSKNQISAVIGDYEAKKYVNSKNMSFANALFIRQSFRNSIKQDYIDKLTNKYNAEVIYDPFNNPNNINSWVKNKTLNLLDNLVDDVSDTNFVLINALAIDMDWNDKFIHFGGVDARYNHENFGWYGPENVSKNSFSNFNDVSGMEIIASLNNYDIIKDIGEDKIRETVGNEFRNYLKNPDNKWEAEYYLNGDNSIEGLNKAVNKYLDEYIKEIKENYKKIDQTTDFSLYVDDDVKVFAKDLKEYDSTTLQYIGIMPTNQDLNTYVDNINSEKINKLISNLKELKLENFKDGVVTKITGFIPKFKFDYELNLQEDLNKLGITDVFDLNKSDLSGITSEKQFITATHKANIEFTQDGIKAAAATALGGKGAGMMFDYFFDVPVEEIDLTFDKPYMFIIRDKDTGEVWFAGTVYEPLKWEDEPERNSIY